MIFRERKSMDHVKPHGWIIENAASLQRRVTGIFTMYYMNIIISITYIWHPIWLQYPEIWQDKIRARQHISKFVRVKLGLQSLLLQKLQTRYEDCLVLCYCFVGTLALILVDLEKDLKQINKLKIIVMK